jgi:hypothetical protein
MPPTRPPLPNSRQQDKSPINNILKPCDPFALTYVSLLRFKLMGYRKLEDSATVLGKSAVSIEKVFPFSDN